MGLAVRGVPMEVALQNGPERNVPTPPQLPEHLRRLEAESIHIFREVVAEASNPVLLYSVGKDSSVLVRLAQKAFHPARLPLPLLHVDTTMKFKEMYTFRDEFVAGIGAELRVYINRHAVEGGANPWRLGTVKCCGLLKTQALLQALTEGHYDVAIGGARREEERSRAKERVFSFRDRFGQWDPKRQRPELWRLYNTRKNQDESIRVFPLSNWTELDIWEYIRCERLPLNSLYFAHERDVVVRENQIIPFTGALPLRPGEQPQRLKVRFRTLGCYPCTGAVRSEAGNVDEIIAELRSCNLSERITRVIDHDQDGSMEEKKREGYF